MSTCILAFVIGGEQARSQTQILPGPELHSDGKHVGTFCRIYIPGCCFILCTFLGKRCWRPSISFGVLGPTKARCKELVSGLRKDANLQQGLTWGKHCPGATSAPENSSERLWEGPEPALPVLHSPYLRSPFLRRPPRVFTLPESRSPESPELKSLSSTALSHSLVPAVFQGALSKSLSHARSCQALLLGSQANPGTARALLLPQTSP